MNMRKFAVVVMLSLSLAMAFTVIKAYADEFDQAIKLTFSQPIAIPGQVLPAGTYWFQYPNHGNLDDPNVMQVLDGDRKKVIATLTVVSHDISQPSGDVIVTLADRSPKPQALLNIAYPGRETGHTFEVSYSKQEQGAMSEFPKITLKVGENGVMKSWKGNDDAGKNTTSTEQSR
jgi:hypothetical protein